MTATTSLIDAGLLHAEAPNGISYACRRFGNAAAGLPVVFLQHFRGNIDNLARVTIPHARKRAVMGVLAGASDGR
jgi:hypothetical protein